MGHLGSNACHDQVGPDQTPRGANPHLYLRDIERIVSTVFDEVAEALVRGDRVELRGFGAFSALQRNSRSVNPRTGDEVKVPEKVVPYFKTGKDLRQRSNLRNDPHARGSSRQRVDRR